MIHPTNQSAMSFASQQASMANTAATTFTKVTKRMFKEIPPTPSRPTLNTKAPIRIPSIELYGFKRIMTSPTVLNTTSEMSRPTILPLAGFKQNNATNLYSTDASAEIPSATGNTNPWITVGFIAIVIVGVAMLISTISVCLEARKKAAIAQRQKEEEEAEEARKTRLAGLRHVRVELKDLGEIMKPERAVL